MKHYCGQKTPNSRTLHKITTTINTQVTLLPTSMLTSSVRTLLNGPTQIHHQIVLTHPNCRSMLI